MAQFFTVSSQRVLRCFFMGVMSGIFIVPINAALQEQGQGQGQGQQSIGYRKKSIWSTD
jgi:hypothetical protein